MTNALTQPWAERLAWTLLHFIWQGTLLAAFYALARMAGRGLTARTRYAMACAILLAMALAPAATYLWLDSPAAPPSHVEIAANGPTAGVAGTLGSVADPWQQALPWIVMAWFAGVAACSIRLAAGCLSAASLRTSQHQPAASEWQSALERLKQGMRIARSVRLLVSERVDSPSVVGWLRPVILAPMGLLTGLPSDHVEALLAHELAHIRRHDYLVNVLQGIVESVLFYHPAVWWLSHQIRAEREHCCDDLAVAASGDVLTYARALAELEAARPAHFKAALAANDGSLLRRIRRLIDPAAAHASSGSGTAWLLSVLLLLAVGGVAVRGAQDQPAAQPPTVTRDSIWMDTVKQGDLTISVRALGVLTSAQSAELHVAQSQVKEVQPGQPAVIEFPRPKGGVPSTVTTFPGVVTQVRPGVTNGTVTVDVQLNGPLPQNIAPQAKLDGTITIRTLTNVLYVGRPIFSAANKEDTLFKLEPDGQSAIRVKVQYGASSVNAIQVKSGLQPGDKVILSDLSAYEKSDRVSLK